MKKRFAIFDMDGLIADTEPIWQDAEIHCFSEAGLELTREMCHETMGLRVDEAIGYWYDKHPCHTYNREEMCARVMDRVELLVNQRAKPLPGVVQAIGALKTKGYTIGLASSSHYRIIEAILKKTGLHGFFSVLHSAQDEQHGKPHPAVYLTALKKMGAAPEESIAFEDSVNGMKSALAAGIYTIVVPDTQLADRTEFNQANLKLNSLEFFDPELVA